MTAPRLHVLTALNAPDTVILRRGPSRQIATYGWNRETGVLTEGQRMAGRIFPFRSDLAPDGLHWVYHADTGRGGYRTVIARTPWLRAEAQIEYADGWGGGGAFTATGAIWLSGADLPHGTPLRPAAPDAFPGSTDGFHMGDTHATRLRLRGWQHESSTGYDARLSRALPGGWTLLQGFGRSLPLSASYVLRAPDGTERRMPWSWADLWGETLQVASAGRIARLIDPESGATEILHDLTGPVFAPRPAPIPRPGPAPDRR
ncbi:hypothetical protein [Jannaschia seohaensis]|uniref:Uncharacterized protein n=1 Tax=Jannaschia seohaensis TaxID=475081 RepID=A0A2Y9AXC6_9RHOB|nr:hypothetical protein [Jannaschia seohaensis]PWJ18174.1 hypothetical protein BCF38_105162 [Jannaschia seohaensis]SSA46699.1 hypothetical protein SAMN05421539_105162 [Jannaschia seohaensis]